MDSYAFLYAACVKATLVLAGGGSLAWLLRRRSAAVRYFVWTATLVAALATPVLSIALERWNMRLTTAAPAVALIAESAVAPAPVASSPAAVPSARRTGAILWMLWATGAAVFLMRLVVGHVRIRAVLRRTREVEDREWTALLARSARQLGLRRTVELRRGAETEVPLSYGFLRPAILLPHDCDGWSVERRRVVLTHELIHVRRWDPLWSLAGYLAAAAYWFHPLAWLALSQMRKEQERSCDDGVLQAGVAQSAYADHLVGVARSTGHWVAATGMARPRDLEDRVRALLDPARNRGALSRRTLIAALSAVALCVVPLAALRGQAAADASLAGSVYDASGAAVPFATVLLKNLDGNNQEIARAGAAGQYGFAKLNAGKYNLEVRAPGFAPLQKSIAIEAGASEHLDLTVNVGAVTENIDVIGKGPQPMFSGAPHRIRVGGNVQATKLLKRVPPAYPLNAQSAGISGTVLLRAVISTDGNLLGLSVINTADAALATAAMDAVRQWKYQPTLLNGVPVEVVTTIAVNFKLES